MENRSMTVPQKRYVRRYLIVALLMTGVAVLGAQEGGVRRFGLFVGANNGGDERVQLRYAVSDAERVQEVLGRVGGIADGDAILLADPVVRDIRSSAEEIRREIARAEADARRVEFVFYYSGHSDENGLLVGGELFSYRELRDLIADIDADVAIALLDSCSSGSFTRLKGGRRAQPFLIDDSAEMSGYAFLTSSSDDEASQESDEIGASFFTHYLTSGLLGAADSTRDGRVTLNEVYQYAFTETLSRTSATLAGPQHPAYDIQLTGAGDLVLTDLTTRDAMLVLEAEVSGRVFIRDESTGRLVAELEKFTDGATSLAVAPGTYRVELRKGAEYRFATVRVNRGEAGTVAAAMLVPAALERNTTRGDSDATDTFGEIRERAMGAIATVSGATREALGGSSTVASSTVSGATAIPRDDLRRVPFVLDVVPGLRLYPDSTEDESDILHNLVIGLPIADVQEANGLVASLGLNLIDGEVRGVETGYIGNIHEGRMVGVQNSSFFNIHSGEVVGMQASGIFNVVDGSVRGVQGSGIFNLTDRSVHGIQAAGIFSITGGQVVGFQANGVVSIAERVDGVQTAVVNLAEEIRGAQLGVVNVAENVRGAMVGVVNVAEDVDGVTLGLLNIVRFGVLDLSVTIDDMGAGWISFQHGTERLYTIYQVGGRQTDTNSVDGEFGAAIGIGSRLWSGALVLDADLSAKVTGTTFDDDAEDVMVFPSLRLSGGVQFGPHFAVIGGISFDTLFDWNEDDSGWTHEGSSFSIFGDGVEVYPHVFAGIKI